MKTVQFSAKKVSELADRWDAKNVSLMIPAGQLHLASHAYHEVTDRILANDHWDGVIPVCVSGKWNYVLLDSICAVQFPAGSRMTVMLGGVTQQAGIDSDSDNTSAQ